MNLNDLSSGVEIIRLESSLDVIRGVIQKRLDFAAELSGFNSEDLIQITDQAYKEIAEVTRYSPGLALEVMKMVMPSEKQMSQTLPYIITEDHIKKLGLTYEKLCKHWDNPLRGATFINVKPWYEE